MVYFRKEELFVKKIFVVVPLPQGITADCLAHCNSYFGHPCPVVVTELLQNDENVVTFY